MYIQLCLISFVGKALILRNVDLTFGKTAAFHAEAAVADEHCYLLLRSLVEIRFGLLAQELGPKCLIFRTFRASDLILRERVLGIDWPFQVLNFQVFCSEVI